MDHVLLQIHVLVQPIMEEVNANIQNATVYYQRIQQYVVHMVPAQE
jgi:hypothetical protein